MPHAARARRSHAPTAQRATAWLVLALSLCTPACTYLGDRGRDFLEIFRLQGGIGRGVGVTARAAGLADLGLNTPGQFPRSSGVGIVYGTPYFLSRDKQDIDFMRFLHDEQIAVDETTGEYLHSHKCWGLLPAVFARVDTVTRDAAYPQSEDHEDWVEGPWLWSEEALEQDPWAHVHAFDVELGAYLLVINGKAGFSPGEAVDFLLGLFGIDIAGDDHASRQEGTP